MAQDALSGWDLALDANPEAIYTWQNGNNESKDVKEARRDDWGLILQVVSASRKERLSQKEDNLRSVNDNKT